MRSLDGVEVPTQDCKVCLHCSVRTKFPADSVETCRLKIRSIARKSTEPSTEYRLLACGSYLLDKETGKKSGTVSLFGVRTNPDTEEESGVSLRHVGDVDTSYATFDLRWKRDMLGVVTANSTLDMYKLQCDDDGCIDESQSSSWVRLEASESAGTDKAKAVHYTNLEWISGGKESSFAAVVSQSDGRVSLWDLNSGALRCSRQWSAHEYACDVPAEIWSVASSRTNVNVVLSGADDCKLKLWDTRTECRRPSITWSGHHDMGVTAIKTYDSGTSEHLLMTGSYDENVRLTVKDVEDNCFSLDAMKDELKKKIFSLEDHVSKIMRMSQSIGIPETRLHSAVNVLGRASIDEANLDISRHLPELEPLKVESGKSELLKGFKAPHILNTRNSKGGDTPYRTETEDVTLSPPASPPAKWAVTVADDVDKAATDVLESRGGKDTADVRTDEIEAALKTAETKQQRNGDKAAADREDEERSKELAVVDEHMRKLRTELEAIRSENLELRRENKEMIEVVSAVHAKFMSPEHVADPQLLEREAILSVALERKSTRLREAEEEIVELREELIRRDAQSTANAQIFMEKVKELERDLITLRQIRNESEEFVRTRREEDGPFPPPPEMKSSLERVDAEEETSSPPKSPRSTHNDVLMANIRKLDAILNGAKIEAKTASVPDGKQVRSEDSVDSVVVPMPPPPGALKREGFLWVAHYHTSDGEEHYVGTYGTRDEAMKAYREKAAYYIARGKSPATTSGDRGIPRMMIAEALKQRRSPHYMQPTESTRHKHDAPVNTLANAGRDWGHDIAMDHGLDPRGHNFHLAAEARKNHGDFLAKLLSEARGGDWR
eukprot:g2463.t1